MSDIPFMVPYWSSFGILALLTAVSWITFSIANYEGHFQPRVRRNILRAALVLSSLLVIGALFGFWVPFLIPGLY